MRITNRYSWATFRRIMFKQSTIYLEFCSIFYLNSSCPSIKPIIVNSSCVSQKLCIIDDKYSAFIGYSYSSSFNSSEIISHNGAIKCGYWRCGQFKIWWILHIRICRIICELRINILIFDTRSKKKLHVIVWNLTSFRLYQSLCRICSLDSILSFIIYKFWICEDDL